MSHTAQHVSTTTPARHAAPGVIGRTWSICKEAPGVIMHRVADAAIALGELTAGIVTIWVYGAYLAYVVVPTAIGKEAVRAFRAWRDRRAAQARKLGTTAENLDAMAAAGVIDGPRWAMTGEVLYNGEVPDFETAVNDVVALAEELLVEAAAEEPIYAEMLADMTSGRVVPIRRVA